MAAASHTVQTRSITGKKGRITFVSDDDVTDHIIHVRRSNRNGAGNRRKELESIDEDKSDGSSIASCVGNLQIQDDEDQDDEIEEIETVEASAKDSRKRRSRQKNYQNDHSNISQHKKSVNPYPVIKLPNNTTRTQSSENQTPYNLRRRITKNLSKMALEENQFSESSDDSDESDSSVSNEINEKSKNSLSIAVERNISERYFRVQAGKSVTSNHTLSRLENPLLDRHSLLDTLKSIESSHRKEIDALNDQYLKQFPKWMFQINEGFNLLFYGFGSKRKLLLEFREKMLSEMDCLVVNGFFTNLTLKSILQSILEEILEMNSSSSPEDMLNTIRSSLTQSNDHLYIIFHNIDGVMLRSHKIQDVLSKLAEIKQIHIIASIDHINAPLIWNQRQLTHFNWIWHDVTTFLPYTDETTFENTILVQSSNTLVLSSLIHVFRSLNPKAKRIFLMLAKHQLDNKDDTTYLGMSYQNCYHKCREEFLVNSDLTLKAQLTEFKDHKLIKTRKGPDGVENLYIPLEPSALADFVDQNK